MSCLECGAPLSKRQKKFCGCKCMNTYNARAMTEKRKLTDPDAFRVCPVCEENLSIWRFSLIDKTDASKGHRDVCKCCSKNARERARKARSWKEDAVGTLLMNSKQRAKKAGMEHTLTREDIVIPDTCPVLGIELHTEDRKAKYAAPSIDRINNTKGYVKSNIIVVSVRANLLKKDATIQEMRQLADFYEHICD